MLRSFPPVITPLAKPLRQFHLYSAPRAQTAPQFILAELQLAQFGAVEQAAGEAGFAVLQLLDFLFQAATGDEFLDEHRFVLADALGAIAGLGFGDGELMG